MKKIEFEVMNNIIGGDLVDDMCASGQAMSVWTIFPPCAIFLGGVSFGCWLAHL